MGAYKRYVVVVIKMSANIHGVLIIPILQHCIVQLCGKDFSTNIILATCTDGLVI